MKPNDKQIDDIVAMLDQFMSQNGGHMEIRVEQDGRMVAEATELAGTTGAEKATEPAGMSGAEKVTEPAGTTEAEKAAGLAETTEIRKTVTKMGSLECSSRDMACAVPTLFEGLDDGDNPNIE